MKRHFILAILSLTAILLAGNVSYSQYRENNETFNIPVDTSGRYIFSVNTCPGEDCSTQMNVSFAADKNISECYVYLVSSRKRRSAGGYRLIPSELTLCTVYDSIYSKKANGENFYEDAVFHKFSCSFTNLKPDKYRLDMFYGGENKYLTTKIKVKKNQTSYQNLKLKKDQKPK